MSHFYSRTGQLLAVVPNASKPGEVRDATLADARKENLGPSVTTCLQLLAKPTLADWIAEQHVKAAMTTPMESDEGYDEWLRRVKYKAGEISRTASDFGTQVHRAFESLTKGADRALALDVGVAAYQVAHEALKTLTDAGLDIEQSELSFGCALGYGGTVDIIGRWLGRPAIMDVKTQELETPHDAKYYPEHALQLAGYAIGIDRRDLDRVSIIVSRSKPGVVDVRNWSTYQTKNGNGWPNERADAAWLALLETWFLMNNWRPQWD